MSEEDTRLALWKSRKEDLIEAWIGLNTLLEASGVRREKAEQRIQQLEEALERMVYRTEQLLDYLEKKGVSAPVWKIMTIQEALKLAQAALSREPSEAPEKEEE